jgi:hypothetical protein
MNTKFNFIHFLLVSWALLMCSLPCFSQQGIVPNASFEEGESSPRAWQLSGEVGEWASEGHTGSRSVSISGTGAEGDFNYWICSDVRFEQNQTYRISCFTKVSPDAAGGAIMIGTSFTNRSYHFDETEWTKRSFIFTTPADTKGAYLRFGQFEKSGTVWFDDIELVKVEPIYRRIGDLELGKGEQVQNGIYTAQLSFRGHASYSARALQSHSSSFNTNSWWLKGNADIVYCHQVGAQKSASVTVQIGWYQMGECVVDASSDGENWTEIGRFRGVKKETFALPMDLFPLTEAFLRLRAAGEKRSFQIHSYAYKAQLDGYKGPSFVGTTDYLEILTQSLSLPVEILSLGNLYPGRDKIKLRLNHTELQGGLNAKLEIHGQIPSVAAQYSLEAKRRGEKVKAKPEAQASPRFSLLAFHSDSQKGDYKPGEVVILKNDLKHVGDYEMDIIVTRQEETLYHAHVSFTVPHLYESNFGYFLADDPTSELWWCQGTYKISRERPSVDSTREKPIIIKAAKNEYEPFQLVIRPKRDLRGITVQVSDFASKDGHRISAENVSISLVQYVPVQKPTDEIGAVGAWPDPLPSLNGTFDAWANINQPLWITVYVPKDANSGEYQGNIILATDTWKQSIPIQLDVWNFSLPEETHVRTWFGFSTDLVKEYHHLETNEELWTVLEKYYRNFSTHRVSPHGCTSWLAPIQVDFGDADWVDAQQDEQAFEDIDATVDFTEFSKTARKWFEEYHFNTLRLPVSMHSIARFKRGTPEHEALFTRYVQKIQEHLEANGWLDKTYVWTFDEPRPGDYDSVRKGIELLHRAAPKLTRLLTTKPVKPLYGYTDIWGVNTLSYDFEIAEERRKVGEPSWWYIVLPEAHYCNDVIDHYAVEMRMWLWQTWKYKVEGIISWHTNWWANRLESPPAQRQNPYTDTLSYYRPPEHTVVYLGDYGNGAARFIYPPKTAILSDDKCFEGPVNSIRWEILREGIEDYEYFYLLRDLVERAKARGEESEEVAKAEALLQIPDSITKSLTKFSLDPKPLYEHREKVAEALERLLSF